MVPTRQRWLPRIPLAFDAWCWQILDVLVQAASELAGWARPSAAGGGGGDGLGPGGELPSSSGGSYPSALMQEAKGAHPQGSVRRAQRQKPEKQGSTSTGLDAATTTVASTDIAKSPTSVSDGGAAAGNGSRRGVGGVSAGGTTRRWGYRRGPREQLRRNLFGRFAPVFFYPLAQVSTSCASSLCLSGDGRVNCSVQLLNESVVGVRADRRDGGGEAAAAVNEKFQSCCSVTQASSCTR